MGLGFTSDAQYGIYDPLPSQHQAAEETADALKATAQRNKKRRFQEPLSDPEQDRNRHGTFVRTITP